MVPPSRACQLLSELPTKPRWKMLEVKLDNMEVKIEHEMPPNITNSWNPIFVGKIQSHNGAAVLNGYFRFSIFVIIFITLFLGYSAFNVIHTYLQPDSIPGFVEGWKQDRMKFDLSFFGFAILINVGGWLFGIPNRNKIIEAISESAQGE